jgi:hypothetical protein
MLPGRVKSIMTGVHKQLEASKEHFLIVTFHGNVNVILLNFYN